MTWEYTFSGHVQGVGFRYRTAMLARKFEVTGFVRNRAGGDVQLVVDGELAEVERFVSALRYAMQANIDRVDRREIETTVPFTSFDIHH